LADCVIQVYAIESCIVRAKKLAAAKGEAAARPSLDMARYYAERAIGRIESTVRRIVTHVAEADNLSLQMAVLRRVCTHRPADTIRLGRDIARHVIA